MNILPVSNSKSTNLGKILNNEHILPVSTCFIV